MTVNEWAKDFRSFVNELQMPRDDYKGIMEYIDDALALLKEQEEKMKHLNNITLEYEKEVFRLQAMLKEQGNCENCAIAIEDRQPVVRCKDCKYCTIAADKKWRQDFGKSIYECDHKGVCFVEPDWFCADGERQEGR